jgi:methionyl-tRNA synthetase
METILYVTDEVVRQFAILAQPVMPELTAKLLDLILPGTGAEERGFKKLGAAGRLVPGTPIPEPQGVFPRYVDPEEASKAAAPAPQKQKQKSKKPGGTENS